MADRGAPARSTPRLAPQSTKWLVLCTAALLLDLFAFAEASGRGQGLRDLTYNEQGQLCFTQLLSAAHRESEAVRAEVEAGTKGFYGVDINIDIQSHDWSKGAHIWFDRKRHKLQMDAGINTNSVAWGRMVESIDKTGWDELYLETTGSGAYTNDVRVYCAGLIEGMMTGARVSQFYSNGHQLMLKDEAADHSLRNLKKLFFNEIEWIKKNSNFHAGVLSKEPEEVYFKHTRFIVFQIMGLRDGYNELADKAGVHSLNLVDLWCINNHALMPELMFEFMPAMVYERRAYQESISLLARNSPAAMRRVRNHPILRQIVEDHPRPSAARIVDPPRAAMRVLRGKSASSHAAFASVETPATAQRLRVASLADVRRATGTNETTAMRYPVGNAIDSDVNLAIIDPVTGRNFPAGRKATADEKRMADKHWERQVAKYGHCSAFIRVTSEYNDILAGHTTWDDYSMMTRIFKYYKFKFKGSRQFADHIAMSSYPGCVSSTDNFYMLNSGLLVMDTSLEILNPKIYDRLPEFPANSHMPSWMHVMVVNRLARNGGMWGNWFGERNCGQDNAQWMVLNYNGFSPGSPVPDGTLFVVESVPGISQKGDLSQHLRDNSFWGSYNRPYFGKIRDLTGHTAAENFYGALYSYDGNPRASIFASIAPTVESLLDMRNLMRRNQYPNEGVSPNSPGHAISARNDLDPVNLLPNGGIDAKITGRCLFGALQCQAICGPTHDDQSVFQWRGADHKDMFPGWPHFGLPDSFGFDWVQMTPAKSLDKIIDLNTC